MKSVKIISQYYQVTCKNHSLILIIYDTGKAGCLKILANNEKYFTPYLPEFHEVINGKSKKVSRTDLKSLFKKIIQDAPKFFNKEELIKLGQIFHVKIDKFLSEKTPGRKDMNFFNKAEKWEVPISKRKIPVRNVVKKKTTKRK